MLTPETAQKTAKEKTKTEKKQVWTIAGSADRYEVELVPYTGIDFSKLGFLFCGQGQMSPGIMAELIGKNPFVLARLKELDEIAGAVGFGTPSDYVLNPKNEIPEGCEAFYSYTCLYTLQVAMFETMLSTGHFPQVLSGHSFGEFAQLTTSGVIGFQDMINFFISRERCLREIEGSYTMFAVNNSQKVNLGEIPFEVYAANRNTLFQTAYVCREEDFDNIRQTLRKQRIACVKVPLESPFHTPWLKPAHEKLSKILDDSAIEFHSPKIPFVSSVTGKLINKENFASQNFKKIMADQLIMPVNFPEQLKVLREFGIYHYFELSPNDVLSAFVEQVFEAEEVPVKINSFRRQFKAGAQANKTYDKLKNSKVFSTLDGVLKTLTGYSIQQIKLEDRIREDLGIDSIKKAEIVFEIIDSLEKNQIVTPANLSDLSTFGDILEYFETSRMAAEKAGQQTESVEKVVFEPMKKVWKAQHLNDFSSFSVPSIRRMDLSALRAGATLSVTTETDLVVFDGPATLGQDKNFVEEAKWWLEFFQENNINAKKWIFLHSGSQFAHCLDSFFTTYSQELKTSYKSIELSEGTSLSDNVLHLESLDFYHLKVRYSGEQRFVRDFVKSAKLTDKVAPPTKVISFGGFGGIGYQQLLELAKNPLETLVVFGRKAFAEDLQKKVKALPNQPKNFEYIQTDIENITAVAQQMGELFKKYGNFDLTIHSVGLETSELLDNLQSEDIDRMLTGKVRLADLIKTVSADYPAMKVIFNSSIASEFGNKGQTPYVMANTYLNQLAENSENITSILWPGWEDVGVAAQAINSKTLKLQGVALIDVENGLEIFRHSLQSDQKVLICLSPGSLLDYASIGQFSHEFSDLMKPASRNYSLFVLSGLTQSNLPYLKDHIIKKTCIFPASGSIALMMFRAYLEKGQLGNLENFMAHNFLMVAPDHSGATIEVTDKSAERMSFQLKSHQLLTSGDVVFGEDIKSQENFKFSSDYMGKTDFDANVPVYTGPAFELAKHSYVNSETGHVLLDVDLKEAPVYMKNEILDKLHRLMELCFSVSFAKTYLDEGKQTVPKAIDKVIFHHDEFYGQRFCPLIKEFRLEGGFYYCDIITLNEKGKPAITIKNLKSIIVGTNENTNKRGFELIPHKKTIF